MILKEYLDLHGIKKEKFAQDMQISLSYTYSLLNHYSRPGKFLMKAIERKTKGYVTSQDWR